MSPRTAVATVFGTSFCILVLEILAGRLLAPVIGVSLETFTGIIGTVLAGIAVGNAAGGRLADRHEPRSLIGPALILGGALTWLTPLLAATLDPVPGAGPVTIVTLSAVLFFAPATVLSSITPLVAKLQLRSLADSGTVVGNLSAAGTAGALAGTFATGFFLVAAVGTRTLIFSIGALLVAVGSAFTGWSRLRGNPLALLLAVGLGAGALLTPERCDAETAYVCAELVVDADRANGHSVVLNGFRNSYIDTEDPSYLEFRYMRLFAQVVESVDDGPVRALHLGGAGLTFPRYLRSERPGSTQTVLEIDGDLVAFVEEELGTVQGQDLQVIVGDARQTLSAVDDASADVVIADAFSGLTVPWHLTTTQFVAEIDRVVVPGGLVIVNAIDGGDIDFARATLATYATHFRNVGLVEPPGGLPAAGAWNLIIIASDDPLDGVTIDAVDGRLLSAEAMAELMEGATVLDDDFAPVDQMRQAR